jgi:hypothetical protein
MSQCVWALVDSDITEHMACSKEGDARAWLASLITTLKNDDQVKVFVTLWAIWHASRKVVHEQQYHSPLSIHCFVERFINELKQVEEQGRKKQGGASETTSRGGYLHLLE